MINAGQGQSRDGLFLNLSRGLTKPKRSDLQMQSNSSADFEASEIDLATLEATGRVFGCSDRSDEKINFLSNSDH